jgi:hypothetical protein
MKTATKDYKIFDFNKIDRIFAINGFKNIPFRDTYRKYSNHPDTQPIGRIYYLCDYLCITVDNSYSAYLSLDYHTEVDFISAYHSGPSVYHTLLSFYIRNFSTDATVSEAIIFLLTKIKEDSTVNESVKRYLSSKNKMGRNGSYARYCFNKARRNALYRLSIKNYFELSKKITWRERLEKCTQYSNDTIKERTRRHLQNLFTGELKAKKTKITSK